MRRIGSFIALASVLAVLLAGSGCQKKVEVRSGTRVVCTYGEAVSDDVKTVSVPANKAGAYRVETQEVTCDRHRKLEALYAQAQTALGKGDLATAKAKLLQVVASDSTFRQASAQLSQIAAGAKPKPDLSAPDRADTSKPTLGTPKPGTTTPKPGTTTPKPGTATPKPGDANPTGPVVQMLAWAPDVVPGFAPAKPLVDPNSFSRQYVPATGSKVTSLVIVGEQYRTSATAKAALSQVEGAYFKNVSRPSINGRQVYCGTDGRRFAILAFTDGAILVQVEMSAEPGQQATLIDPLTAVAKQMP